MIKLSEVVQGIKDINRSFQKKQNAKAEIKYLHDRLLAEVRGTFTDVDLTLMQLRESLGRYLAETDLSTPEAAKLFEDEAVKKFVKDIKQTGITRLVVLIQSLERLRWE